MKAFDMMKVELRLIYGLKMEFKLDLDDYYVYVSYEGSVNHAESVDIMEYVANKYCVEDLYTLDTYGAIYIFWPKTGEKIVQGCKIQLDIEEILSDIVFYDDNYNMWFFRSDLKGDILEENQTGIEDINFKKNIAYCGGRECGDPIGETKYYGEDYISLKDLFTHLNVHHKREMTREI